MSTQQLTQTALLLLLVALISFCTREPDQKKSTTSIKGRSIDMVSALTFLDESLNVKSTIDIAIAKTEHQRNLGLMDVYKLVENQGMLFLFEKEQPLTFWMANTPLPLDIFFVNKDSVIIRVHKNTQPLSNSQYGTDGELAQFVVETNAGYSTTHDIKEGDRIWF